MCLINPWILTLLSELSHLFWGAGRSGLHCFALRQSEGNATTESFLDTAVHLSIESPKQNENIGSIPPPHPPLSNPLPSCDHHVITDTGPITLASGASASLSVKGNEAIEFFFQF